MIGARLKLARAAAGLSLRELEGGLQGLVTAQAIGKYERDEMMPSSSVLIALARTLKVSEEYLLAMERKAFTSLLTHPKTQERIMGMMSTGKPVRN